ncbi:MAG: peptidylprolyl isomerase [Planctomycetaceae bacterium]|nr:peptidylprolyl isomerase [Planctomycetaceae bacterium]
MFHNTLARMLKSTFSHANGTKGRRRGWKTPDRQLECLESRQLLTVTLSPLTSPDLPAGKTLYVPLTGVDSGSADISYSVTSSDANVTASILSGGQSIAMTVTGKDSQGNDFSGTLTFRLFETLSPDTTARIKQLVSSGFYDNLTFHRIINGFVAQGGDPNGDGTGGSGTDFSDEFNTTETFNSRGLLAMANSGDDTNDSQFFVVDTDLTLAQMPQHLNFDHSIFGILTSGFDTFNKIMTTPVNGSTPTNTVRITNADIIADNQNGVLVVNAPNGFTGSSTIEVTATGGGNAQDVESFSVAVVADTVNDKAFLGDVQNLTTPVDTPITFTVQGIDLESDDLTFVVSDPATFTNPSDTGSTPNHLTVGIQITPASGNTPSFATITLTPESGFEGDIEMLIGVRDQTNRGNFTLNSRSNYDTQKITLTVGNNVAPTADAGGPYTIDEGSDLTVSATASADADNDTLTYSWDINGDGTFGDATGVNPTLTAAQLSALGINDGPGTFPINVRVDDGHGHVTTSSSATLTVNNVIPTLEVTGPTAGTAGESVSFSLVSTDVGTSDQNGTFTYTIDWDNDGTDDETITGTSSTTVSHTFNTIGTATYKITTTDKDGGVSQAVTRTIDITEAVLPDGDVEFVGTDGSDRIRLRFNRRTRMVRVFLNGELADEFEVTGTIHLDGGDGDDYIRVGRWVKYSTVINGGDGDDVIIGGMRSDVIMGGAGDDILRGRGRADVLVGGDGDDKLFGDHGRDVIIGGAGADELHGGLRGDLMIGGETDFDDDAESLLAILTEWKSRKPIDERIANLTTNGVGTNGDIFLDSSTVTDDAETDKFFGYYGHDWFIDFPGDQIAWKSIYDRYGLDGTKKNA